MTDWQDVRARFPALEGCVYLNTAAGGPISERAARAGTDYYRQARADGDVHWDEWNDTVDRVRERVAALIGASAAEIGFVANASAGINVAVQMLRDRGRVLVVRDEFPSVTLPWLQRGRRLEFVDIAADEAPIESIAARLTAEVSTLAISQVQFRGGLRLDLAELGELCAAHDVLLVCDATQAAGAVPVDVGHGRVDFLVSSAYKWLNAGYGVGVLYVNERHLDARNFPAVGWRSAREPYRLLADVLELGDRAAALELGHPPFAAVFTLGAALELVEELGIEAIEARIQELNDALHERLDRQGLSIVSPRQRRRRAGITMVGVDEPAAVADELRSRGVLVSARGDGLRVSVHYYNDLSDIDRLVAALADIGVGRARHGSEA